MSRLLSLKSLVLALVALLVVGFLFTVGEDDAPPRTLTANFPRAVSIYEGSDVRILGVSVGRVTAVTPDGESVRVDIEYDGQYDLPADARAVIVTPTLVSDRFVQLTPVYTEGPVMADGADIALPDTGVPVELDRIYATLKALTNTLGPNGVNANGTLDNLLEAGANGLDGQGRRANQTIRDLAQAASTFGDSSGDLFETVTQLATFTSTLAENDAVVRAFIRDLAGVSSQLADERDELQDVLGAVAGAVGTVQRFVRDNRDALVTDVEKLTRVVKNINSEKQSLNTALAVAPVAIGNLFLAYNSESGTVGSRIGISGNAFDADGFLCSIVQQSALPKVGKDLACTIFETLLEPLTDQLPTLPPGPPAKQQAPTASRPAGPAARTPAAPAEQSPAATYTEPADDGLVGLLGGAR